MDNYEAKISGLKSRLEAKKQEKTRAEANLEMAEKQLKEVTEKIRALGYEPEQLLDVITQLQTDIAENLAEAERILAETEQKLDEPEKEAAAV